MATNLDMFRADLTALVQLGEKMILDLHFRVQREDGTLDKKHEKRSSRIDGKFEAEYQNWYTEAHSIIRQLIPDRISEFEQLYKGDGKRKVISGESYTIQDWLRGIRAPYYAGRKHFDDIAAATMRLQIQVNILQSASRRFESSLFDIRQIVQADLFNSELEAARELTKKGFLRGAGAIAGVVLERHLAQVARNHNATMKKKRPKISDYNDLLKNDGVVDVPFWRKIQRLGDIRNLCDHDKERDPTKEELEELVDGVDKITKTLF